MKNARSAVKKGVIGGARLPSAATCFSVSLIVKLWSRPFCCPRGCGGGDVNGYTLRNSRLRRYKSSVYAVTINYIHAFIQSRSEDIFSNLVPFVYEGIECSPRLGVALSLFSPHAPPRLTAQIFFFCPSKELARVLHPEPTSTILPTTAQTSSICVCLLELRNQVSATFNPYQTPTNYANSHLTNISACPPWHRKKPTSSSSATSPRAVRPLSVPLRPSTPSRNRRN